MCSTTRYLPTYQDAVMPYSLRLPAYRSSYIRRYHPYARYVTPPVQEPFMEDTYHEEPLLDLSILNRRIQTVPEPRAQDDNVGYLSDQPEQPVEEHPEGQCEVHIPLGMPDAANAVFEEQEDISGCLDQTVAFVRVDMA